MIYLWILYPLIEAFWQAVLFQRQIDKYGSKQRPDYLMLFIIRGMVAICFGALLDVQPDPWYQWPALVSFQVGTFWLLFDPILNWFMGERCDYEGKNSGWLKFVPAWVQIIISLGLIFVGLKFYY